MSDNLRRFPISQSDLEAITGLQESVNHKLFRQTFNDFLIMEGISPDMPIGVRPGMVNARGVWQPGIMYTQYHYWEMHIDEIWSEIRTSRFGKIYTCKN